MSWMTAPGMVAASCQGFAPGLTRRGARIADRLADRIAPSARLGPRTGTRADVVRTALEGAAPVVGARASTPRSNPLTSTAIRVGLTGGSYRSRRNVGCPLPGIGETRTAISPVVPTRPTGLEGRWHDPRHEDSDRP